MSLQPNRSNGFWRRCGALVCAAVCCATLGLPALLCADQVDLQNGDRYVGRVLLLDDDTVTLHSDVLGTIRLPRAKVANIALGAGATNNTLRIAAPTSAQARTPTMITSGTTSKVSGSPLPFGADSNLIHQIQGQLLGTEGVEANQKFNAMVAGFLSGQLTASDIRAQAQAAADQLKKLKSELGDETGGTLDGYLAILEKFLGQTTPPSGGNPAMASPASRPTPEAGQAGE